jgi:dCMP deaminase
MPDQIKLDKLFMDMAYRVSMMSHDEDTQVGCIIVKDGNVLSMGYNGMPSGMDNACKSHTGSTLPEVIHAEANAICKLARSTHSSEGATLYCTLAPCVECAKLILQSGISRVVFSDGYKDESGTILLLKRNLAIDKVKYASSDTVPDGEGKKS